MSFSLLVPFSFSPIKFSVKDFSATTATRILRFGTSVGYDLLCNRESACSYLSFPLFAYFFLFFPIKFFITDFSARMRVRVFKFCISLQRVELYVVKENHDAEIYFAFFFHFFHVMHREICIEDFTTVPKILKFGTNIGYVYFYYVRENQPAQYLFIFSSRGLCPWRAYVVTQALASASASASALAQCLSFQMCA